MTRSLTRELATDPPGYPGRFLRLLEAPPTLSVAGAARSVFATSDADLLNPIVPQAYGSEAPRLVARLPRSASYWRYGLDSSGRVVQREKIRDKSVVWTDSFVWTGTSVTGTRIADGSCTQIQQGELAGGELMWLAPAHEGGTEWFRFVREDGHVTYAVRKIHLAAELWTYRLEWQDDTIQRVWVQTWRATSLALEASSDEWLEFSRKAPALRRKAHNAAVDEVTKLASQLGAADALLLVDDPEEPAFPPRAILLRDGARYSRGVIRERIATGPYDAELDLGVPDDLLDQINKSPDSHQRLWRFAKSVLRAAAKRTDGPALGVSDFEVSRLEWIRS